MFEFGRSLLARAPYILTQETGRVEIPFTLNDDVLKKVAIELKDTVVGEFPIEVKSSNEFNGGVDFVSGPKPEDVVFTLCIGNTSTLYLNKSKLQDKWIYKSRPNAEITSKAILIDTLKDFILTDPKPSEIMDVSLEALEKKTQASQDEPKVNLKFSSRPDR